MRNAQYIIKTKKSIPREIVMIISSIIVWTYVLIVIGMFVGAIFDMNSDGMRVLKSIVKVNNDSIREFLLVSFVFFISSYIGLWGWRTYNYKRYGKLNRRSHPPDTTKSDILEMGLVNEIDLYKLQNNKVIILENSPIKEI